MATTNTSAFTFKTLNDKDADKAIKSIMVKGAALRKLIHETACGLVMHMIEHGRHTKFLPLADAIGKTLGLNQRKAFIEWVIAYTHLIWNKDEENFAKDADKANDLEAAKATPFWAMESRPNDNFFDFQKAVTNLLRQARAKVEAGKFQGDPSMIDSLEAAFQSHAPAPKPEVIKAPKAKKTAKVEGPAPVEA